MAVQSSWYGDSVFVETEPPGGCNIWGVEKPGQPVSFEWVADRSHIAAGGQRVCVGSMNYYGDYYISAIDLPTVLNMLVKNTVGAVTYLDETAAKIHAQTSLVAKQAEHAENALDMVTKGAEAGGVQELQSRLGAAKQKIETLEKAIQESVTAQEDMSRQGEAHGLALKLQKETLEAKAGATVLTAVDQQKMEAHVADVVKRMEGRLAVMDKTIQEKCSCLVQ